MEKSSIRIPSLDGLRTISIALVIIGHMLHVLGVGEFGNFGNLGVRVFFVISGFLITGLLAKEIEKTSTVSLLKFYFRRTLRIFPPYYFYLFMLFVAGLTGLIPVPVPSILLASIYLTDYISPSNWFLGHTWSLAVEEQFYLILPGVVLLLGIRRTKALLILIVILSPIIRVADFYISGDQLWVLKGFHANMDALAAGCLLALFRETLHRLSLYRLMISSRIVALLPIMIIFFNFQIEHPRIFYGVSISAMNLMIAFCLDWSVTNHDTVFGRFLNSSPMVTLGVMSYSIYLWQQPFFNPDVPGILTQTPFNFIGLAIATLISYYMIEKSSLKLRHKWENRIFDKKSSPNTLGYITATGEAADTI